jgi:hypothetical protein
VYACATVIDGPFCKRHADEPTDRGNELFRSNARGQVRGANLCLSVVIKDHKDWTKLSIEKAPPLPAGRVIREAPAAHERRPRSRQGSLTNPPIRRSGRLRGIERPPLCCSIGSALTDGAGVTWSPALIDLAKMLRPNAPVRSRFPGNMDRLESGDL